MDDDLAIVLRVKDGNGAAFEEIVHLYEKKIYTYTYRMTGSREDAYDLSQEIFLRAYKSLAFFKMESKFSTWLYRIAANICVDFFRKNKKHDETALTGETEDGPYEREIADRRFSPESELEKKQLREEMGKALQSLSREHRQMIVMRDINGLSYTEIAQALELEEGTVKSRIARARSSMRRLLLASGNISPSVSSNQAEKR